MSRWLTQLSKKKNQKTKQLWEKEFSIVEEGLNEEQVVAFVDDLIAHRDASQKSPSDSVRSIIERAVTDAEQIANSLKMKAQKEAAEEAIRIIDKAKQEAEEIRRQVETVTQKETGDILSVLNEKTRLIEEEAKQKVELLLLQTRQEIEKEVREEYKEAHIGASQARYPGKCPAL
jgi:cell division septum initiation protein DivIVA